MRRYLCMWPWKSFKAAEPKQLTPSSTATEGSLFWLRFQQCRAKFVAGSVALLLKKEGGGDAWLKALRGLDYREACQALITLPGVGPKVTPPPRLCSCPFDCLK